MTKYVVNSGGIDKSVDKGRAFFSEVVEGLGSEPKFLLCSFAQPREVWEEKFSSYSLDFTAQMPHGVKPKFELAFPDTFTEQLKATNALYMAGGDDYLLQYWLKQFDLPAIWNGKVIATNSASSNALSKYYWTCDWRQCGDGLGVLPIKFLPHYMSSYGLSDPRGPVDWARAKAELEDYGEPDLPVYALKEGGYKVFKT